MNIYNPSMEERAFLYQEAQDLAPLVKELGSLSVLVEEFSDGAQGQSVQPSTKNHYRVTFLVAPESMGLKVHAENTNLFAATIAAKEETQRQLNALVNSLATIKGMPETLH